MEGFGDEDRDLMEFTIKAIEAGNPEVVCAILVSDYSRIFVNSEPSNQDIQVNDELASVSHGLDMVSNASNNQYLLNSNLSHNSQGYEIGKRISRISIYDNNISYINHDSTMQMKEPNTHETSNSQAAFISQAKMKTDRAFLFNSKLFDGCHEYDMTGSANHLIPNDMLIATTVHASNRKINVSNDRMIAENNEVSKKPRQEICGIRGQVLLPCSFQGNMNYDFAMDKSATTNQMTFDCSHLAGTYHEFPTLKEPHSYNQGMKEFNNLRNNTGLNIPSHNNISQSPQNENTPSEISHSDGSKLLLRSSDDIHAVPGPSWIHQNKNALNLREGKFQPIGPIERHTVEVDKKMLMCKFCKKEFAKHWVDYERKFFYECCVCRYKSEEKDYLQVHVEIYSLVHYYCNVCGEVYMGYGSHDRERTCYTCGKNFLCKGMLEQHSEDHKDYYDLHCRICMKNIYEHLCDNKQKSNQLYKCCLCQFKYDRCNLQVHLHSHTDLSLFKCNICGKRFRNIHTLRLHFNNKHL